MTDKQIVEDFPCSVNWEITCDSNSTDVSGLSQYIGYSRKDKLGYE